MRSFVNVRCNKRTEGIDSEKTFFVCAAATFESEKILRSRKYAAVRIMRENFGHVEAREGEKMVEMTRKDWSYGRGMVGRMDGKGCV